jgi:hypothetical protein
MAKTSLTGITGPTEVRLPVRVVSPATRTSPLTGMTAVAFEWAFFVSHMQPTRRRNQLLADEERVATPLGREVDIGPIEVETLDGAARIPITTGDVRLDFTVEGAGVTLDRALPPQMAHIMDSSVAQEGVVSYHESSLTTGSVVELRAHVAPSVDAQGNTTFRVCPELGTIRLVDQEPDFGRKRRKVVPIAIGVLLVGGFFAYAVVKDPRFRRPPGPKGLTQEGSASTVAPLASECAELRHHLDKLPCVDDLDESVAQFCDARPGCPAATRRINHCRIAHGEPHCTPDGAIVSLMPFECMTQVSPSEPPKPPDRAAICAEAGEPFTP